MWIVMIIAETNIQTLKFLISTIEYLTIAKLIAPINVEKQPNNFVN